MSIITGGVKTSASDRGGTVSVRCLQSDGRLIYGGCSDGSLRCWVMATGSIIEVYRHSNAHSSAINSLSLNVPDSAGASAAGDSSVTGRLHQQQQQPSQMRQVLGAAGRNSYSAAQHTALLVSAGEDCSVKVWRVYFSGDYH